MLESWTRSLNAVEENRGDISEEVREDEDELHAWCLLEESENVQWQEVARKKPKLKTKKFAHESLLSVENNSCPSPRKVVEVKDNWVNIRATGRQELQGMSCRQRCSRVKLDSERNKEIRCSTKREDQRLG